MKKAWSSQEYISKAAGTKPESAYLIIGDDGYLVDRVYQTIRDIVRKSMPTFELITLYGDELNIPELSDYLESYSLFSDNRLLVIRNADRLGEEDRSRKSPEKQKRMLDLINNYLQSPDASTIIILIANTVDARLAGWKKLKETCQIIECEPIKYSGAMKDWLEKTLRANQKTMDAKAKDLFLSKVELDFCSADNELSKLYIFCGDRKAITTEDINTTMPTSRAGALSDFYKVLGNRNTKDTLLKINEMLDNDWEPLQILSNISRFFMTIWKIHALRAKHISVGEIVSKHLYELFESQRSAYMSYSNTYPSKEIAHIFSHLLETDSSIKLSMAEPEVLLNLLIVKVCYKQNA